MTTKDKGIELSGFALTALRQREADPDSELAVAVAFYLAERDTGRPGWPYPGFLPSTPGQSEPSTTIALDRELWDELAAEAERQGVAIDLLAAHAAIYFAAELDAGRITRRIVEELDAS